MFTAAEITKQGPTTSGTNASFCGLKFKILGYETYFGHTWLSLPLPSAWNLVQSWIIQDRSEEPDQNSWIYISSTELLPQEHISSNDSRWLQSDLSGYQRISAYQHIAGVSMYPWTTWVPKQWSRRFGKIWGQWLSFISQNQHSEPCLGHGNIKFWNTAPNSSISWSGVSCGKWSSRNGHQLLSSLAFPTTWIWFVRIPQAGKKSSPDIMGWNFPKPLQLMMKGLEWCTTYPPEI